MEGWTRSGQKRRWDQNRREGRTGSMIATAGNKSWLKNEMKKTRKNEKTDAAKARAWKDGANKTRFHTLSHTL